MIDPDSRERAALKAALKSMAALMAEIGWETRLRDLNAMQAGKLTEAAVDAYLEAMATSEPRPSSEVPF